MSEDEPRYGIGEVTERTGLTATTLRFYEDEGLFAHPVHRDSAGRRRFSEGDVEWLLVCSRLRGSDMPLPAIRRYVELYAQGPDTVEERLELLRAHQAEVRRRVEELEDALSVISAKTTLYEKAIADGTAHELWAGGPLCD